MNEQLRKETEIQRHYDKLMYRYNRLKRLPYERLKSAIIDAFYLERICNFFGRTIKYK